MAAIERPSASEGERRSAEWVAGRLRELGAEDVAVEPYRGAPHYGPSHAILFALGALGRRLPARCCASPCSSSIHRPPRGCCAAGCPAARART